MAVQPCLGIADVDRPVAIPGQVDPDGRSRPDINVDVVAMRVQPAAEPLAGMLEGSAVVEKVAVLDAIHPHVGRVTDLVVRAQRLRVVGSAIAAHEMKLPTTEVTLNLSENAQEPRRDGPTMSMPVAEEARELEPLPPARDAVPAERPNTHDVAAVEVL
jgi:hypothetical protein